MKDYIEEGAIDIANYIIENNATVRQTAKQLASKEKNRLDKTKENMLGTRQFLGLYVFSRYIYAIYFKQ